MNASSKFLSLSDAINYIHMQRQPSVMRSVPEIWPTQRKFMGSMICFIPNFMDLNPVRSYLLYVSLDGGGLQQIWDGVLRI